MIVGMISMFPKAEVSVSSSMKTLGVYISLPAPFLPLWAYLVYILAISVLTRTLLHPTPMEPRHVEMMNETPMTTRHIWLELFRAGWQKSNFLSLVSSSLVGLLPPMAAAETFFTQPKVLVWLNSHHGQLWPQPTSETIQIDSHFSVFQTQ